MNEAFKETPGAVPVAVMMIAWGALLAIAPFAAILQSL